MCWGSWRNLHANQELQRVPCLRTSQPHPAARGRGLIWTAFIDGYVKYSLRCRAITHEKVFKKKKEQWCWQLLWHKQTDMYGFGVYVLWLTLPPLGPGKPMTPGWPRAPWGPGGPGRPSSPAAPYTHNRALQSLKHTCQSLRTLSLLWEIKEVKDSLWYVQHIRSSMAWDFKQI